MDTSYDPKQQKRKLQVVVVWTRVVDDDETWMKCWTVELNLGEKFEKRVKIDLLKSGGVKPSRPSENGEEENRTLVVFVLVLVVQRWLHPLDTCGALNDVFS